MDRQSRPGESWSHPPWLMLAEYRDVSTYELSRPPSDCLVTWQMQFLQYYTGICSMHVMRYYQEHH